MARSVADPTKAFRHSSRPGARRIAVNVTVDCDILTEAKALKINISRTLEDALRDHIGKQRLRQFEEEHAAAFDSYNQFIAENGLWGEDYREW